MDDFNMSESNPQCAGNVRCLRCGQVFRDDLLYLNPATDEWCCKDWPTCEGAAADIEVADRSRKIEEVAFQSKSDFDPVNQYAPPKVPILVRCVVCRRFFMSNEMRFEDGKWKCWLKTCDGYGFGLNIFKATHEIFAKVGVMYRHKNIVPGPDPDVQA